MEKGLGTPLLGICQARKETPFNLRFRHTTMNEYAIDDFIESLSSLDRTDIRKVLYAWGESPEGGGSWEGGFILQLKNGKLACVTGWCDYTGWGCQDGRDEIIIQTRSRSWEKLKAEFGIEGAISPDKDPVDLNRWVAG